MNESLKAKLRDMDISKKLEVFFAVAICKGIVIGY